MGSKPESAGDRSRKTKERRGWMGRTNLLESLLLLHLCQPPSTLLPLLGLSSKLFLGFLVGDLQRRRQGASAVRFGWRKSVSRLGARTHGNDEREVNEDIVGSHLRRIREGGDLGLVVLGEVAGFSTHELMRTENGRSEREERERERGKGVRTNRSLRCRHLGRETRVLELNEFEH